ncbi:DNA polymerase IV [Candidatus Clostridium radicumherbarum]|uniref:DNA polymerase IV n=1 Tax=Candidatus Clostridium radicumherbarum TaxID=3381662 RepID=A0ABW8TMU4_9CLOT
MERKIIHVDMDAFFASVEIIDNPSLRGKPVVVGGTTERGVVATCSYEARSFGIKSAMPIYMAKVKCPQAIFLPVRYGRYKEVSNKIFQIFYNITQYVEPMSIDEAYLDITLLNKDPVKVAKFIKQEVKKATGLTISAGVSYNKFLAKLASDWNKPNGLKVIEKNMVPEILFPLPVSKVYGLGQKSAKKLNDIGIFTVKELYDLPQSLLVEFFGKFGVEIYDRVRGIDNREVHATRERKSIGRETTLRTDTDNKEELKVYIKAFARSVSNTMHMKNVSGKSITIKIKTSSFVNHTRSKTLMHYISNEEDIYNEAIIILEEIELQEKIRLIGLSISSLKENYIEQMSMF